MSRANTIAIPAWTEPTNLDVAKRHIWNLGQTMHEHAYLIGCHLLWVNENIGHGNFLPWVADNLWFSQRTAYNMMLYAKQCNKQGNLLPYEPKKLATVANLKTPTGETIISSLEAIVASGRKFATIYADPPWPYQNRATRAAAENHYSTMTIEQIAELPIQDVALDAAHLHLWTTLLRNAGQITQSGATDLPAR